MSRRSSAYYALTRRMLRVSLGMAAMLSAAAAGYPQETTVVVNQAASAESPSAETAARKFIASGNFAEAETLLRAELTRQQGSGNADERYLLAYALLRQNHPKEALEQYTQAAALRKPTASELNDVAKTYVLLEDYTDAAKWLNLSLEMNPKNPETWYSLGRLRFSQQRFSDALGCFQRALSLAPKSVKVENNLGLAYYGMNKNVEAEAAYRQAIQWQDAGPAQEMSEQPLLNLGLLLVEEGQLDEAKVLLSKAAAIAPNEPRIHEQLGQISSQKGNFSDAQAEFEKAVQLDPQRSSFHFLLGQAYQHLGRTDDAKREFATASRISAQGRP